MRTQATSSQNFNGKLIYITRGGNKFEGDAVEPFFNLYKSCKKREIRKPLEEAKCDVFISRPDESNPLKFSIMASDGENSTPGISVILKKKKEYTEAPRHYKNSNDVLSAIKQSIKNFNNGVYRKKGQ